jgi:nucleotide-binding universal stress UspA family protein
MKAATTEKIVSAHLETTHLKFGTILLATDFSANAKLALRVAARFGKNYDSKLVLFHSVLPVIVAPELPSASEALKAETDAAKREMKKLAEILTDDLIRYQMVVHCGRAVEGIRAVAASHKADLIVMGSHGASGLEKLALGSVAEAVLRHSHVPVLVVGPRCNLASNVEQYTSVLLATDLNLGCLRATQYAASIAEENNAKLTLVHVEREISNLSEAARKDLEKKLCSLLPNDAALWCRPKVRLEFGDPSTQIVSAALAEEADLVVVGTHDTGALSDHAPWSVISKLIRGLLCPVLAVASHAS